MERIKLIWEQLKGAGNKPGLYKVRFSDNSGCDLYLGLKVPEAARMLIIRAPYENGKNFDLRYDLKGLKFEKVYDADDSSYLLLNLFLTDNSYHDVFDTLISDVVTNVIDDFDIKTILKKYSDRLLKWQALFDRASQNGLSPEEQRGLYGELYFLRKFLNTSSDYSNVISSWKGPDKNLQDYQFNNWAVEVKTSVSNNHQKLQISNERQLDTSHVNKLILYHLSLDQRIRFGETLNQIVDSVLETINRDFQATQVFHTKLIDGGYFQQHRSLYEETGYSIRETNYYQVKENFPRIEENELRKGVGEVKYSIIVSQCAQYLIEEHEVFKILSFDE